MIVERWTSEIYETVTSQNFAKVWCFNGDWRVNYRLLEIFKEKFSCISSRPKTMNNGCELLIV